MPSSKKLFFGNAPFAYLAGHLAKDEDFLNDARLIVKLDNDAFIRLKAQLGKTDGFLDRDALTAVVSEVVVDGAQARKIASIIYRIGGLLYDADMPAKEAIVELAKALDEHAEQIDSKDRQTLIERVQALAVDPMALAKQYKARQLEDATGAELDEIKLICDIRPIFDEGRERIVGAIPLSVLRLEYSSADGESQVLEIRITEKQIDEFAGTITTAKRKLTLINEHLRSHSLPIPRLGPSIIEEA